MSFLVVFGIMIANVVFAGAVIGVVFPKPAFDGPVETRLLADVDRVAFEDQSRHPVSGLFAMLDRILDRLEHMLRIDNSFEF